MTDFLNDIEEENIPIFIPSVGTEILYKPLSTKQLKEILQSVVDTSVGANSFLRVANKIVGNNIDPIDFPLNIRDRDVILYTLRRECIGSDWKDKSLPELKPTENKGILRNHFIKLRKFTLELNTPTLEREGQFQTSLQPNNENLEAIVGELFIKEITKYATKIVYQEQECNLSLLSPKEQLALIEKLPSGLIHKAAKAVETIQREWNEILTVDGEVVSIDPEFFA
jgi:hypothetical protein